MSNVPFAPNTFTHHCAPLPDNPRTHNTASRTFAHAAAHFYPHSSAPASTLPSTHHPTSAHVRALFYQGAERLYDVNGAVLPYEQIVDSMQSERLYGGI